MTCLKCNVQLTSPKFAYDTEVNYWQSFCNECFNELLNGGKLIESNGLFIIRDMPLFETTCRLCGNPVESPDTVAWNVDYDAFHAYCNNCFGGKRNDKTIVYSDPIYYEVDYECVL